MTQENNIPALPPGVVRLSDRRPQSSRQAAPENPPSKVRANTVVQAAAAFGKKYRVLLLEPDKDLREVLRSYLNTKGFEVVIPDNPELDVLHLPGVTATARSAKDRYDAVIYGDMSGPAMHEIAPYLLLAWKIAQQRQDKTLPIITITDNLNLLAALNPLSHERSAFAQVEGIWRDYFYENGKLCSSKSDTPYIIEHCLKERIDYNRTQANESSRGA